MILDTSALLAILLGEPTATRLIDAIATAEYRRVAAPTLVEASAVLVARKGPAARMALDALLARLDVQIIPFTAEAATFARSAYQRFGRGVGSPGVLNYGDCLAYGAAMAAGEPLLCLGEDFGRTDVQLAEY